MDQNNRRLFAVCDDMIMAVVDADSGKVIATPRIGYGPYVSFFDPNTQLVFSSNGAGTLSVIHEDSPNQFTVLDNVHTDWLARHMALDQKRKTSISSLAETFTAALLCQPLASSSAEGP